MERTLVDLLHDPDTTCGNGSQVRREYLGVRFEASANSPIINLLEESFELRHASALS